MGPLLQLSEHLAASEDVVQVAQGAARLRPDLEDLPPDVREYRHCHRQRPRQPLGPVGPADGASVQKIVCRPAHARASTALEAGILRASGSRPPASLATHPPAPAEPEHPAPSAEFPLEHRSDAQSAEWATNSMSAISRMTPTKTTSRR